MNVTLSLLIWVVLDESLCVKFETMALGEVPDRAIVTVLLAGSYFFEGCGVADDLATYVFCGLLVVDAGVWILVAFTERCPIVIKPLFGGEQLLY